MITSKKKGQISVEALIIVGVLVVGGIIFATVFLSQMNNQAKQASDLSGLTDSFLDDLGGWNTPGTPNTPTVNCIIDGVCQDPPENASNCPGDCVTPPGGCNNNGYCEASLGETAANCSDCFVPVFSSFTLNKLVPTGDSAINSKFSLKAKINSSYPSVEIYDIMLKKYDDSIMNYVISNKCTIKGVAPDTATGIYPGTLLMTIEDVSLKNQGKIIDEITCSEEGEYRFSAMARPKDRSGVQALSASVTKTITSTVPEPPADELVLSVKITEPENGKLFFKTDNITLRSEYSVSPEQTTQPTYTCIWKDQKNNTLSTQCSGASVSANSLDLGRQEIYLYVTANIGGGALGSSSRILNASDKVEIEILESVVAGQLYLSVPSKNYAGVPFNIRVYSLDQTYPGVINDNSNFIFTNNNSCNVTTSLPSTQTIVVGGQTIYFKDFSTECGSPAYVSCPNALQDILVKATHHDLPQYTAQSTFTSEFDLRFNAATCNSSASETGGSLKVCVFSESGTAKNFNCSNLNYGLLEATVNLAESNVSNAYGELKIYIE